MFFQSSIIMLVTMLVMFLGISAAENNCPVIQQQEGQQNIYDLLQIIRTDIINMDKKIEESEANNLARYGSLDKKIDKKIDESEAKLERVIADSIEGLKNELHDANSGKVSSLQKCSVKSSICSGTVTAHYVVHNDYVFGLSVAHSVCYRNDDPPTYAIPCDNLDIALYKGIPPEGVALLNITSNVVNASLGDAANAFGFADGNPRSWHGTITGKISKNFVGEHWKPNAYENAEELELLFFGAQDSGMSGGGVINRKGYLGVCRAVWKDNMRNLFVVVTPWSLIKSCVDKNKANLTTLLQAQEKYPNIEILRPI